MMARSGSSRAANGPFGGSFAPWVSGLLGRRRVIVIAACALAATVVALSFLFNNQVGSPTYATSVGGGGGSGGGATSVFRNLAECVRPLSISDLPAMATRLLLEPEPDPQQRQQQRLDSASTSASPAAASGGAGTGGHAPPQPPGYLHTSRLGFGLDALLRQQLFCEEAFPLLELEAAAAADGAGGAGYSLGSGIAARQLSPGVAIYVYAGDDEVSRAVREGAGWENDLLHEVLWALEQPLPTTARQQNARKPEPTVQESQPTNRPTAPRRAGVPAGMDAAVAAAAAGGDAAAALFLGPMTQNRDVKGNPEGSRSATALGEKEPAGTVGASGKALTTSGSVPRSASTETAKGPPALFVDVGANVGWFSINVAAKGYRVAAFEGMAANVGLMRSSICGSPGLGGRLRLFAFGLGSMETNCYLFSDINNRGDGITMCDAATDDAAVAKVPRGYALRGRLPLHRLDNVLGRGPMREEIKVLKADVEGYEPHVFAGLGSLRPWYIATEFNTVLLSGVNRGYQPIKMLEDLIAMRYRLSTKSFKGPWLNTSQIQKLATESKVPVSVYAVWQELLEAEVEAIKASGQEGSATVGGAGKGNGKG